MAAYWCATIFPGSSIVACKLELLAKTEFKLLIDIAISVPGSAHRGHISGAKVIGQFNITSGK